VRYHDSVEKSGENLRLALPLMARQAAALDPISYAIWYEYVAGINPQLRTSIDELLRNGEVLDEEATVQLYHAHIAELDGETVQKISQGFQRVMTDISDSAAKVAGEAGGFGDELAAWFDGNGTGKLGLDAILSRSSEVRHTVEELQGRLDQSRQEIETLRQQVARAREDALVDGLTRLTNRKGFDSALLAFLEEAAAESRQVSLLMADIDHFKHVNDTYGHLFGDKVIQAVAAILRQNVKGKDTAARYGGEEFVVILPDTMIEGARHVAETVRKAVEACRIKRIGNGEIVAGITISLGAATYSAGESAQEFVMRADQALYESKQTGRNRVTLSKTKE
jgi:diguanylate cyclase